MKAAPWLIEILARCETEGNALRLPEHLSRPCYVAVDKVLQAAGGKWNRKAKAHLFEHDAGDAISQIVATGEYQCTRTELQQFYTPPELAAQLVDWAQLRASDRVLEPSAGQGALATEAAKTARHVRCIELDPRNVAVLRGSRLDTLQADFLAVLPVRRYSAVIMNPPFAGQADLDHVEHALNFLEPGGRLAAIVSAGVLFRTNRRTEEFGAALLDRCQARHIRPLEPGAFKASGTMVNAAVITATLKEYPGEMR